MRNPNKKTQSTPSLVRCSTGQGLAKQRTPPSRSHSLRLEHHDNIEQTALKHEQSPPSLKQNSSKQNLPKPTSPKLNKKGSGKQKSHQVGIMAPVLLTDLRDKPKKDKVASPKRLSSDLQSRSIDSFCTDIGSLIESTSYSPSLIERTNSFLTKEKLSSGKDKGKPNLQKPLSQDSPRNKASEILGEHVSLLSTNKTTGIVGEQHVSLLTLKEQPFLDNNGIMPSDQSIMTLPIHDVNNNSNAAFLQTQPPPPPSSSQSTELSCNGPSNNEQLYDIIQTTDQGITNNNNNNNNSNSNNNNNININNYNSNNSNYNSSIHSPTSNKDDCSDQEQENPYYIPHSEVSAILLQKEADNFLQQQPNNAFPVRDRLPSDSSIFLQQQQLNNALPSNELPTNLPQQDYLYDVIQPDVTRTSFSFASSSSSSSSSEFPPPTSQSKQPNILPPSTKTFPLFDDKGENLASGGDVPIKQEQLYDTIQTEGTPFSFPTNDATPSPISNHAHKSNNLHQHQQAPNILPRATTATTMIGVSVDEICDALNLGEFKEILRDENIRDLPTLKLLSQSDYKDLGFKLGDIKRLMLYVQNAS
eukprot:Awhi_evm1s15482